MDKHHNDSAYYELNIENPEEMVLKANIVAEIIESINFLGFSIKDAAVVIGSDEWEFNRIICGHFHTTDISTLKKYLATLSCCQSGPRPL